MGFGMESAHTEAMKRAAFALALLTAASSAACLVTRADDGRSEGAVQGGAADAKLTYAVGVRTSGGVCSGTLIAPNLVLTARHCVAAGGSSPIDCKRDRFGAVASGRITITTDAKMSSGKGVHAVASVIVPGDEPRFCGGDIALLVLADLVPSTEAKPATPAVRFAMTDRAKVGASVAVAGYGVTAPDAKDAGQRRLRTDVPIVCIPGDAKRGCSLYDSDREFSTEGSVCFGDSGSGAYEQASVDRGDPIVLGVLSRGAAIGKTCGDALYTRTDRYARLIVETAVLAAKRGGYAAPAWAGSASGDAGVDASPDASSTRDASSSADGGRDASAPPVDAGASADSGSTVDAGPAYDAGSGVDASSEPPPPAVEETPTTDAMEEEPSGRPSRSLPERESEDETVDPEAPPASSGCSSAPAQPRTPFVALGFVLACLGLRGRRRR